MLDYLSKGNASEKDAGEPLILKSEIVGKFLLHRESSIRIGALSLLIMAPSTAKPLTSSAMAAIINGLPSMHAESDSHSRGVILSLTRRLILRLKGGILKDSARLQQQYLAEENLRGGKQRQHSKPIFERDEAETKTHLEAYIGFLNADIRPTASYQRHITALKALMLILESGLDPRVNLSDQKKSDSDGQWKVQVAIFRPGLLRKLTDLLGDPFDDVRATSLYILNIFPPDILLNGLQGSSSSESCMRLTNALSRAEKLASNTSRADHADTVARLYHLLFSSAEPGGSKGNGQPWWSTKVGLVNAILEKMEDKLSLSGVLFNSSIRDAPLHGYLSALRFVFLSPTPSALEKDFN